MTPKVFCVGFNGTGTNSVQAVLEDLGYQVSGDYRESGIEFWKKLEAGDLSEIKQDSKMFDAFQGVPWFLFYKEFDQWFSDSKFILTIGDSRTWWKSFQKDYKPLYKSIFGYDNPTGYEKIFIELFERHTNEVIDHFRDRAEDLLVINVDQDNLMQNISTFLDKPSSNSPTPPSKAGAGDELQNGKVPPQKKKNDADCCTIDKNDKYRW